MRYYTLRYISSFFHLECNILSVATDFLSQCRFPLGANATITQIKCTGRRSSLNDGNVTDHMDFAAEFQLKFQNIEASFDAANSKITLDLIEDLQLDIKKRVNYLPKYEQQKYEIQLQQAREKVWNSGKSRRFKFKSKKSNESRVPKDELRREHCEQSSIAEVKSGILMEMKSRQSLTIESLRNSLLFAPRVESSIYISHVCQSKVYTRCQQCRVHDCSDIDIFIENCRNPVIENCFNIRFHVLDPCVEISDFNWPRTDVASPNYITTILKLDEWKFLETYTEDDVKALRPDLQFLELNNK